MYLSTWIDKNGGTLKTANKLGVKRNVVYAWLHGIARPRPETMKLILQKSGGKVGYADMIDEYLEKKKAAKGTKVKSKKKVKAKTGKIVLKKNGKLTKAGKVLVSMSKKKKPKSKKVDPGF